MDNALVSQYLIRIMHRILFDTYLESIRRLNLTLKKKTSVPYFLDTSGIDGGKLIRADM